jgi:hypothetical protein
MFPTFFTARVNLTAYCGMPDGLHLLRIPERTSHRAAETMEPSQ